MIILLTLIIPLALAQPYQAKDFKVLSVAQETIYTKLDGVRGSAGLKPLKTSDLLSKGANARAKQLCDKKDFSHDGWKESFIKTDFKAIGENLGHGFDNDDQLVMAWVNSPPHYKNITEPAFTHHGIGEYVCFDYQGKVRSRIVVNYFGG